MAFGVELPQGVGAGTHRLVSQGVRLKGGGHELAGVLIEQLVVDDAVCAAAPGAVEGHLEVLVVDGDLVVGELGIGVHTQRMGTARGVFQGQIPQLHALPPGDKQGLGGADAAPDALVDGIAQPVAAAVVLQRPAAGLPGHRPVLPRLVVPEVEVVPRAVHGHPVGAEPGDPVVLRALVEQIAPGGVVDHGAKLLHPQVVGPGHGHVHPVDDIFPPLHVKMSILHGANLPS